MSDTVKHTPGPWAVTHQNGDPEGHFLGVRRTTQTNSLGREYNTYVAQYCNPEDARLIAAAPEMLEALKGIKDDPTIRSVMNSPLWHKLTSAIEKAEGRA